MGLSLILEGGDDNYLTPSPSSGRADTETDVSSGIYICPDTVNAGGKIPRSLHTQSAAICNIGFCLLAR